jgi:shikimate kinase
MRKECIVLIGMAGVGKSTVGAALANFLRYQFTDLDEYIHEKDHLTIQEIIDARGEEAMMELEKQRMYEITLKEIVIAPGGSIVYHSDLMNYLKLQGTIVYLKDTYENVQNRLKNVTSRGVIGLRYKSLREVYEERLPLYEKYADIVTNGENKSVNEIVREVVNRLQTI